MAFSGSTACAGDASSAANATERTRAEATDCKIKIQPPKEKIRYDILDAHLHFTDFLEQTDGFPALCAAMDMAGVSKAVIFGMGIAKQWDENMAEPPSYYLSNDSRCYYYSATDFLVAEAVKYYTLLDKLRPTTVDKICRENALALIKTY